MDPRELEEIITRAIITYFVDRIMERLAARNLLPAVQQRESVSSWKASVSDSRPPLQKRKKLFSWEDAVQCGQGQTVLIDPGTIVSPLAADELAKRNVVLIRE